MPTTAVAIPTTEDAQKAVLELREGRPDVFVIQTQDDLDTAAAIVRDVKARLTRLDTLRKSMTAPIDAAKKNIMDIFRPEETHLKSVELQIKRNMTTFQQEQERLRLAEEARLRDQQAREVARLEQRAEREEAKGNEAKAEVIRASAPPVPVVQSAVVKPEGISTRYLWKAEVKDLMTLVQAVAEGKVPLGYLKADETALNRAASALKDTLEIPGVRIYKEASVAVRA